MSPAAGPVPPQGPPVRTGAALCLPDDASPEQIEKVMALEKHLQALLDEQAEGVNELIERTVELHRRIKTEIAQMIKQDEEEDALVREVCIRTEQAETELLRNPSYQTYKDQREKAGGVTDAQKLSEWGSDRTLSPHVRWQRVASLRPDEAAAVVQVCRGRPDELGLAALARVAALADDTDELVFLQVNGAPLSDIFSSTADDARLVLGCAAALIKRMRPAGDKSEVTTEELTLLHEWLRHVHAHIEPGRRERNLAALKRSVELKKVATYAFTQSTPLCVAAVPLTGVTSVVPIRVLMLRGEVRVLEQRYPHTVYPALSGAEPGCGANERAELEKMQGTVEGWCRAVLNTAPVLRGKSCVVDIAVDRREHAVQIEWIRTLTADSSHCCEWSELCGFAAAPSGAMEWRIGGRWRGPAEDDPEESKSNLIWRTLLHEERQKLCPGRSVWEGSAPEGVLEAIVARPTFTRHITAPEAPAEKVASDVPVSRTCLVPVMQAAAVAFLGFAFGQLASRR